MKVRAGAQAHIFVHWTRMGTGSVLGKNTDSALTERLQPHNVTKWKTPSGCHKIFTLTCNKSENATVNMEAE